MPRTKRRDHLTSAPARHKRTPSAALPFATWRATRTVVLLALGGFCAIDPGPAIASAIQSETAAAAPFADSLEMLIDWIIRILGGTPLTGAPKDMLVAQLASQYARFGIPATLAPSDRLALMGAIQDLWAELENPPPDLSPAAADLLRQTLKSMWADLTNGLLGPH
jgi:hypothetical protein